MNSFVLEYNIISYLNHTRPHAC